jgi:uncharacterized tellurite resistance protein B-like protein
VKLEPEDFAAMDDAQKAALLEALVTGVLADGKVTPAEIARFDEVVGGLPWGVDRPILTAMVTAAQERVKAIDGPAALQDFVASLAARLPTPALRDKIFYTMATVIVADGEIGQLEKNILGLFVLAFNITSERVAAIKAAVTGRPAPAAPPDTSN